MKRGMRTLLILLVLYGLLGGATALASQERLDAVGENLRGLEGQLVGEEARADTLQQSRDQLYGELGRLERELSRTVQSLQLAEERRAQLEADMESVQGELEAAQEMEREHYEGMKTWIRYCYEYGDGNFLSILLQADSLADVLNRGAFINMLHEYDRRMLAKYQGILEDVRWKEDRLGQERRELEALGQELSERRVEAQNLVTEIKMSLLDTENMLGQALEHAGEYEALIASQREYERELEAERELEEVRLQEEWEASQGEGALATTYGTGILYSTGENDLDLMAAIIECEAGGEPHEGKLAVGSVVVNRIRSPRFPDSMVEVLYQDRQFTPVGSGRFAVVLARGADSSCYAAASEVLAGCVTLDCLFFRTDNGSVQGTVIGNHVFY